MSEGAATMPGPAGTLALLRPSPYDPGLPGLYRPFPDEAEWPRACDADAAPLVAARALDILRARGWTCHRTIDPDTGAVCGGGAIYMAAAGELWHEAWLGRLPCTLAIAALERCAAVIAEQFPEYAAARFWLFPARGRIAQAVMANFNDTPPGAACLAGGPASVPAGHGLRTQAEIELVLAKAAAG